MCDQSFVEDVSSEDAQSCSNPEVDPCEPLEPCQMTCNVPCTPRFSCPSLDITNPMCSPFHHYIQPPRRESCKPVICYQRPSIPMAEDTIYKKSFEVIDSRTTGSCRALPIRPSTQLQASNGDFAKETITKLSYPPLNCADRVTPIMPRSHRLLGNGPMQGLTTQMHDFGPKFQYQRLKCFPRDNITRQSGCVESSSVQRLSFLSPDLCNFSKAESCKPVVCYKRPELPMEFETTQKLSFMPVILPPKKDFPWTRKAQYCPPSLRFAKNTVAKLSYQPPGCFINDDVSCCNLKSETSPRASC